MKKCDGFLETRGFMNVTLSNEEIILNHRAQFSCNGETLVF